jgi:hypothetical protein
MAFPQDLDFLQDPEDPKVQDELWPPISKLPSFEPCYSILAISFIFQFLGSVPQNGWDHLKFGDLTHRLTSTEAYTACLGHPQLETAIQMVSVGSQVPNPPMGPMLRLMAAPAQEMADEAVDLMTPEEELNIIDAQRRELDGQIFSIGRANHVFVENL